MRYNAQGTLLKMGDGAATEVFTTVAQVINITGPGMTRGTQESNDHDTVDWKDFLADALADGGEVGLELHYDPAAATHGATTGLIKAFKDGTLKNWKLVFPDTGATEWAFAAYVTRFEPGAPHDGKLTASSSLKVSGAPTLV